MAASLKEIRGIEYKIASNRDYYKLLTKGYPKKLPPMKPSITLFTFLVWLCSLPSQAQSWQWGAHVGTTYNKMLWADKPKDSPWEPPETQFMLSYALGISSSYRYSTRFYSPFQLDFYNKRFSVSTGGTVYTFNDQGQYILIKADYLDYQLKQLAFAGGIGYNVLKGLAVEAMPYFHFSLGTQKIKVGDVIPWREDVNFQQDYDFGISGYLRGDVGPFYAKAGYQNGLRKMEEYAIFDLNGSSLGKLPSRNTMFLLVVGYSF